MARNSAELDIRAFAPAASVFVSANAGAGKTDMLVKRTLSLLLHGVLPSRILCITFTNAAAAEMSSRILDALGAWVMTDDKTLAAMLSQILKRAPDAAMMLRARGLFAAVLDAPSPMRIETIHGFCQSVLRRFPLEAGVSPHFTVMDGHSEKELLKEARIRLLSAARTDAKLQRSLSALAQGFGEQTLHTMLGEVIKQKRKFRALFSRPGGFEALAGEVWNALGVSPKTTVEALLAEHFNYDAATLAALKRVAGMLIEGKSKTDKQTGEELARWLAEPDKRAQYIDAYRSVFLTDKYTPRATLFTKNMLTDAALINELLREQERVMRFHDRLQAWDIARTSEHVLTVSYKMLAIYEERKRARAAMDYDDLILTTCDLLEKERMAEWVLYKLDGGIDHVLVDEAQDTSPEQWRIVVALTKEFFAGEGRSDTDRSLFVVGDEKQSIFSFQGADVSALGGMHGYFAERITGAGKEALAIDLVRSFRSTKEVLAAVDAVFAQPNARAGIMFSDAPLAHIPTKDHAGVVELWPLVVPGENDIAAPQTLLARNIADTIKGWVEEGRATPGDVMILVRKRSGFVDRLVRALKRRGVPVAGADRMMLGDNLAVQDLIALGQCLLLPEDDLTLAALLKSPIFNLGEDALFTLAHGRGKKSLWERLQENGGAAYEMLADLRARADFIAPYELYIYLLDTLGARRRFIGRMGEEYADPIDEFLSQALLYERSHTPSLQGFMHWLAAGESEIKRDMEQAADAVRIMTVHGAKGLQAPIVILPDTAEPPSPREALLWMGDLPIWARSRERDNGQSRALRESRKQAALAEYRRLLYVALTRAQDRLYVCGAKGKEKLSEDCWYELVRSGLTPIARPFDMERGQGLRLGNEQKGPVKKSLRVVQKTEMPEIASWEFLSDPPPKEPVPPRPLTPSGFKGDAPAAASPLAENKIYRRGLLIHKLLQHLPNAAENARAKIAARLMEPYRGTMEEKELRQCLDEALALLADPKCAFLFAAGSLAEVPVAGNVSVGGKTVPVAGQIDRLAIGEKEVWIADFKTNRAPPAKGQEIPKAYLAQLALYKLLLARIYPEKTIRCALVWTASPEVSVIDDALLDEAALSTYI